MTVSTKTKHTKATISNPNPTHSGCNTLHSSTIFIKICTLVAWMELDYVLCVACGSGTVMLQHWLRRLAFCECPPESPMKCPRPPQFTCQHQALHITDEIHSVSIISKYVAHDVAESDRIEKRQPGQPRLRQNPKFFQKSDLKAPLSPQSSEDNLCLILHCRGANNQSLNLFFVKSGHLWPSGHGRPIVASGVSLKKSYKNVAQQ